MNWPSYWSYFYPYPFQLKHSATGNPPPAPPQYPHPWGHAPTMIPFYPPHATLTSMTPPPPLEPVKRIWDSPESPQFPWLRVDNEVE